MRSTWRPLTYAIISTCFVLLLTACGINNAAFLSGGDAAVSITLTGASTVMLGGQSQYAATVTGSINSTVTWSVNGVAGGNAAVGSISAKGLYVAPANAPQSSQVTITATSAATPTVSKSLPVALAAPAKTTSDEPVVLTLVGATSVTLGTTSQYIATVTGSANTAVTWSVNGVAGGNTAVGSISASGLYTAPSTVPQASEITITATSVADSNVSQSLPVALASPPTPPTGGGSGGGTPVTLALSGATKVTLGTSSQYIATVTGSANTAVTWSVNGVAGGNTAVGSISASGLYTAPSTVPQASEITITATSVADSNVSQSLPVALVSPPTPPTGGGSGGGTPVTLALSGAAKVTLGTSSQYVATVTGTSDTSVTWSVDGIVGGDTTVGTISTKGSYAAPISNPQSSKVTITATSIADPSVSQSLAVTLAPAVTGQGGKAVTVTLSGATSVRLGSSSQYTATVTGSTDTAVTWSVDGLAGGDASVGTVSAKGSYSAPASEPPSSKVTITATSVADSSVSQNLVITLDAPPPPPVVGLTLSGATSVTLGTTSQYIATVTGNANAAVNWSVNGVAGGNATDGTISAKGLYSAPSTAPQNSTVTVTATSAAISTLAKSIVVTLAAPTTNNRIPANAVVSSDLDASPNWVWVHDPGTPGSSQGSSVYPKAGVSADNVAREFYMTYSGASGELFHVSFATDKNATHFVYDAYVYVTDPSQLANLEMDMNDVMTDGRTVILATQCSSYSNSWEYTLYTSGGFHWHPSNIPCSPLKWSANTWHHIQIASERDSNGVATYDWVSVDGQYSNFANATGPDATNLGWAIGDLLINFQIDGSSKGSGSNTIYTDKLRVWRWE